MTITLAATDTLQGKAGTGSAITYSLLGDRKTTQDNYERIGTQGQLGTSVGALYTVPASTTVLIKSVLLANTTGSDVSGIVLYISGTSGTNQITGTFSIPANGTAFFTGEQLFIYSASGLLLTTIGGAAGGDLTGSYPNPTLSPSAAALSSYFLKDSGVLIGHATLAGVAGQLYWDTTENVLKFVDNDTSRALSIGHENWIDVKNVTGGTLTNGSPAYVNGVSSGSPTVALAKADAFGTDVQVGVLTQSIANNSTGKLTKFGIIHGMDTSAFTAGDVVYVSATTAGALTNVAPTGANFVVRIGRVLTSNASTGQLLVDVDNLLADATFTSRGALTATEKIALNSMDGRTSTGTSKRVFRPGDYMVGNTYDPTGASNSTTSFQAMMTAVAAFNDRCTIELPPGVFKIDHDVIKNFGTNNPSVSIIGSGRGLCILLPNAAPTGNQAMITFNRGTTGGDAVTVKGFTIYNTSGTVYTTGAGILTNGADGIDISEVAFIDQYRDIQVSGQPYTMTTNGTTSLTGISPAISAADTGQTISGAGIVPGSSITFVTSSTATLSVAATNSTTATRYLNNTIKCSMQKIVSFNTNAGVANTSSGIYVNNGQAGDTYIGPEIVMSDGGGTTRRRANVEIKESGHYEIIQCNLTGSQRGIYINPDISQSVAFGFHTNVLCDSNTINGCVLEAITGSTIKNIKSVNSWYSGTTVVNGSAAAAGFLTTGAGTINGVSHTSDRFLNNRTHGYDHNAGTDFRWEGCDMKGNSTVGSGTAHGLNVAAAIGNWSVNGGKYGGTDTAPTGANQGYGIMVAAGAGDNIQIAAASLTGNATGPLSFGATGANNFIQGCPGLAAPYHRGAPSASITTATTVANIFIPKNSQRVTTTYRGTVAYQHSGAGTTPTFALRYGSATDAVGAAATNPTAGNIAAATGATSVFGYFTFIATVTALGAGTGNLNVYSTGVQAQVVTNLPTATRASGTHFLAIDTTADRYLTISAAVGVAGLVVYHASLEVLNY